MRLIAGKIWNDEVGSALVDWAVLGAGVMSLTVAVVTTLV